ncbi:MAG: glycosyltransferase family 4 protein [Caldilineaceae bacterium]
MFGKRFVFDHHDLAPDMYNALFENGKPFIRKILLWTEKLSCQWADHVIVTNNSYKQVDMERTGIPEHKITVVRNGPNLKLFRPTTPVADLRKKGKVTICYLGDMGHHDGVDYLLRALNYLIFDLGKTAIYCAMVGGGSAWRDMQALCTKLGLDPYVHFYGPVPHAEVAGYLSAADICVAPEPSNTYNNRSTMIKITEYMAMGKPIVAFDLPEHRFSAEDAALYAEANNEYDFAQKLAILVDNPDLRITRGAIGKQRIETRLAWTFQEEHLLSVYEMLTASAKQPVASH